LPLLVLLFEPEDGRMEAVGEAGQRRGSPEMIEHLIGEWQR
jgi:hypothetical protein